MEAVERLSGKRFMSVGDLRTPSPVVVLNPFPRVLSWILWFRHYYVTRTLDRGSGLLLPHTGPAPVHVRVTRAGRTAPTTVFPGVCSTEGLSSVPEEW